MLVQWLKTLYIVIFPFKVYPKIHFPIDKEACGVDFVLGILLTHLTWIRLERDGKMETFSLP